jgi:hypothetical protein
MRFNDTGAYCFLAVQVTDGLKKAKARVLSGANWRGKSVSSSKRELERFGSEIKSAIVDSALDMKKCHSDGK